MLNTHGQEFMSFRLLIAAIMALAILGIILSIINHFEEQKIAISEKRLYDGFVSAVQSPNGDVIARDDIVLKQGAVLVAGAFARRASISPECILGVHSPNTISFENPSSSTVVLRQGITTTAYFRCKRAFDAVCDIECEISIGEPFR